MLAEHEWRKGERRLEAYRAGLAAADRRENAARPTASTFRS